MDSKNNKFANNKTDYHINFQKIKFKDGTICKRIISPIIVFNFESNIILYANKESEELYGTENLLGKSILKIFPYIHTMLKNGDGSCCSSTQYIEKNICLEFLCFNVHNRYGTILIRNVTQLDDKSSFPEVDTSWWGNGPDLCIESESVKQTVKLKQDIRKVGQTAEHLQIIKKLPNFNSNIDKYNFGYNVCRYHHERYDANGYPDGLIGEEIPICAQVVGIADTYHADAKSCLSHDKHPQQSRNGGSYPKDAWYPDCIV